MNEIITRIEVIQEKMNQTDKKLEALDESIKKKTDTNDVIVSFEKLMKEEKLVTALDLKGFKEKIDADAHERHLSLIKWIVGSGISSIIAITGMIQLFI